MILAFFRTFSRLTIAGLAVLFACGCGIRQSAPQVQYYTLIYDAPQPIDAPALPVSVHVRRFQVSPPYDSRRIVYAENAFQRTTYAYHHWMANPADILTSLFVRDLRAAGLAQTILAGHAATEGDYRIEGNLEEFYEDDTETDWQAVLTLTLTLTHLGNGAKPGADVLLQKTYHQVEPMERNNPVSLARAMSQAMKTVSVQFIKDAYPAIASNGE